MKNLKTYEINFIIKINNLCIKYLIPFYPPYKKKLAINFALFLNSIPNVNY